MVAPAEFDHGTARAETRRIALRHRRSGPNRIIVTNGGFVMFDFRKTAAVVGLSGLAICGIATSASAAPTSASHATNATRTTEVARSCTYIVTRAPSGLNIRYNPGKTSMGLLFNGSRVGGPCVTSRGWVKLALFPWASGRFLHKVQG